MVFGYHEPGCSAAAASLRGQSTEARAEVIKNVGEQIWPLIAAKRIKPVIESTFPLEKAVWAHRLIESQLHFGKILLIADPDKVKADDAARPVENTSTCD